MIDPQFAEPHPFVCEHRFHEERQWRFDFAWPAVAIAVEIEGGTHAKRPGRRSRHTTGSGYQADCEKYNAAAIAGWCVLRYTSADLDRRPVVVIQEIIGAIQHAEQVQALAKLEPEFVDTRKWE